MSASDTGRNPDPRWGRLLDLFSRGVELPEGERTAFVLAECADDLTLQNEVLELLAADVKDVRGNLLTNALGAAIEHSGRDHRAALLGRVLGNYRLTSVVGHGGTGTVYLAERADRQYSAQVAVKVVDSAHLYGDLNLRFRAERQILASLNHPNIARLMDAGETPEGQPYLVMEYIHGEPLDRYCDRKNLSLGDRLKLFLDICSAVQYAHQNLIVHRDLKPANILVTATGTPKLLDFGIAKLLDPGEAETNLALTRMSDRLLTPEYASPEQILGRAVTTSADVYALGVILYELMTGLRPFSVPASASQLELERSICVTDPMRPSVAVRRTPGSETTDVAALAEARGLSVDRLSRKLDGDIDAIVMRALRKEVQSRYASVEQLAADVRRFLHSEPVQARQGNWAYYSQRFVRRHAFGVSAGAVFAAFIIAFAITMSVQRQRVAAERDRAEQESARAETVSDFMLDVFAASEPFTSAGREITARELLDRAGSRIRGDLTQAPEVRARLLEAIGLAYRRQNEFDQAITFLGEALHLRRQASDGGGFRQASTLAQLATALRQTGDLEGADRTFKEALAVARQHRHDQSPEYAALLTDLGRVQLMSGNLPAARKYFEESLRLTREVLGPGTREVASVLLELSTVFLWSDDLPGAERFAREGVAIYRTALPELHPDRVLAETRLADCLLAQTRLDEAAPLYTKSLEAQKKLYGGRSQQVADVLDSLSKIRKAQGLLAEAEEYAREAVGIQVEALGPEHFMTAYFRTALAAVLLNRKQYPQAEEELRTALTVYAKTLPPDHQYIAWSEHILGEVLLATNRLPDAEATLTASMNRWKRVNSTEWRSARSASALGEALYRQGRVKAAEPYLVDSYRVLSADKSSDRDAVAKARERVVRFYTDRGQPDKLEAALAASSPASTPR
jgi:serine/threonine protein kinase